MMKYNNVAMNLLESIAEKEVCCCLGNYEHDRLVCNK